MITLLLLQAFLASSPAHALEPCNDDMMPVEREHCQTALKVVNKQATALDTDADLEKIVAKACAGEGKVVDAVVKSCKNEMDYAIRLKLSDCSSLHPFDSGMRQACNAGVKAVMAIKPESLGAFDDAWKQEAGAVEKACPHANKYVYETCKYLAKDSFQARLKLCGDAPLALDYQSFGAISHHSAICGKLTGTLFPVTFKRGGTSIRIMQGSPRDFLYVEGVENSDGSSLPMKFYQKTGDKKSNGAEYRRKTLACSKILLQFDRIDCLDSNGQWQSASLRKPNEGESTQPPAQIGPSDADALSAE